MVAKQTKKKPKKPRKDFPLFAHSRGYWCKKWKGKQYNFGPWDDPKGAERNWDRFKAEHVLGMEPETARNDSEVTVRNAVIQFLDAKKMMVERGDMGQPTFNQYKRLATWLVEGLGPHRLVETLGPKDFTKLRQTFPASWSIRYCDNRIMDTRTVFKWVYDNALIDRPIRYGSDWSKTPKRKQRLAERDKPSKEFTQQETLDMLKAASPTIRAMILLGINAGYGNVDCTRLKASDIKGVWLDAPRGKTGQERRCWLWKETRDALKVVLRDHSGSGPLLKTPAGNPWVDEESGNDRLVEPFRKLRDKVGCYRKNVGFYSFRHMTETIASDAPFHNVQPVVDLIMGHDDGTMASNYRESISDKRIKEVCQHMRGWLFDE